MNPAEEVNEAGQPEPGLALPHPHCLPGSLAKPFPQAYDLILLLDIVQHMEEAEAQAVIENVCRHTRQVMFASNLAAGTGNETQPERQAIHGAEKKLENWPEKWLEIFARCGFFRDLEFAGDEIYPGAVLFRAPASMERHPVVGYERRLRSLEAELDLMAEANQAAAAALSQQAEQSAAIDRHIAHLDGMLREIQSSQSYRLALWLRGLRLRLAPPGSPAARLARRIQVFRAWRGRLGAPGPEIRRGSRMSRARRSARSATTGSSGCQAGE